MVQRFRRKIRKQRGSMHHGWGIQKGHKKAGSRGGVGKSGGTTHQWMQSIVTGKVYGKQGFVRPPRASPHTKAMNIGDITDKIDALIAKGIATKKGTEIIVDTTLLDVTKVLSKGPAKKMTIIAQSFSANAKAKIEKAGGKAKIAS